MNKLFITGNLTKDPEMRVTPSGVQVCSFTVAVNRRKGDEQSADFFRVTAWRDLAESCGKYLSKGRNVAVIGSVSVSAFTGKDGTAKASADVTANEVEFGRPYDKKNDFEEVKDEQLPWE